MVLGLAAENSSSVVDRVPAEVAPKGGSGTEDGAVTGPTGLGGRLDGWFRFLIRDDAHDG